MKTLMAFSGGLDSTYLAWKILTQTNDTLRLFWMDLSHVTYDTPNGPERYYHDLLPAENIIAPRVAIWLTANVRPVTFQIIHDVRHDPEPKDFPGGTSRGWRVIPMLKTAAGLMAGFDRFVYAKSPENIRTPNQPARDAWYQKWWKENAPAGTTFETPLIAAWQGRPHALKFLPADLLRILLTCNRPKIVDGEPRDCGKCDKCWLTAESKRLLAQGIDPDAALDQCLRLRRAGPYIDNVESGDWHFGAGVEPSKPPPYSGK